MRAVRTLRRALHAEAVRTGGSRSPLWLIAVPLAVVAPLAVALAIGVVAEGIAQTPGTVQVTTATTSNAVYWVMSLTVIVFAAATAHAHAAAERGPGRDRVIYLFPSVTVPALARWIFYGAIAATVALVLVVVTMLVLPNAFPLVYGNVDLISAEGLRFVWAVPVYAFSACGFGVGMASVIGHPAGSVAALLGWIYVVEHAVSLAPNGYRIQAFAPFLNGIYGTGQELAFTPHWGVGTALLYFVVVGVGVLGIGCGVSTARRRGRGHSNVTPKRALRRRGRVSLNER